MEREEIYVRCAEDYLELAQMKLNAWKPVWHYDEDRKTQEINGWLTEHPEYDDTDWDAENDPKLEAELAKLENIRTVEQEVEEYIWDEMEKDVALLLKRWGVGHRSKTYWKDKKEAIRRTVNKWNELSELICEYTDMNFDIAEHGKDFEGRKKK